MPPQLVCLFGKQSFNRRLPNSLPHSLAPHSKTDVLPQALHIRLARPLHQAHCSPPLLRSISQCAYATHQAVSFLNRLFFLPPLKIKNKPALSPVDVPDPCAYCIGRLPLLPVVATLRLPPSLNSRSARAHNFGNTPSSYVFPRFFPTLAQGCFPFSFLG